MLRRRAALVALIVIVTPVCAYLITRSQHGLYEASADVVVSTSGGAGIGQSTDPERTAATQERLARLPAVASRVISSEGLTTTPSDFLSHSSVSVTSGADVLTFSVRNSNAETAKRLATAYAREFTLYRTSVESGAVAAARKDLRDRIRRLKASGGGGSPLYRALVARDEQLAAAEVLPDLGAVVVQPADDASLVGPHPARNTLLGLGIGVLLAIGAAFLAEALDTRIRSTDEIEHLLGRPVLGRLPLASQLSNSGRQPLMLLSPAAADAEAVRMLRASFDFARLEAGARSVLFSALGWLPQKPAVSSNLALALARAGRDVILCDLDCREPSIGGLFDLDGRPGVTDVARDARSLAETLIAFSAADGQDPVGAAAVSPGSLRILPLGTFVPPSPADFVGSRAVASLLAELAGSAEVVLIEAPPLLSVSDAVALSGDVDAIVLEAPAGQLDRETLSDAERALGASSASLLGLVILDSEGMDAASNGFRRLRVPSRTKL